MKSLGNFPDPFIAEIAGQPEAIRRAAAGLAEQVDALAGLADVRRDAAVVFTGMGSSYDACYPAVIELARAGVPAVHVDAAELLHFRRGILTDTTLLVAVSQSGESAEVVHLVQGLPKTRRPFVVAVTNGAGSSLAQEADIVVDTRAGPEAGPSTMTFAAALVVLAAIGAVRASGSSARVADRIATAGEVAASSMERLLAERSLPEELAQWLGGRDLGVILGRGPARAAAEMGALTLKEAVGMPVESLETAQFRHGPLELAGPDLAAMVLATEPETRDLDLGLAAELVASGAAVLVVTRDGSGPAGSTRVEIGPIDRSIAPAVAILPAQLLAWRLAVLRGREPGTYVHAAKVTTHE